MIRLADYAGEVEALSRDRFSAEYEEALERLLRRLFGTAPDCADDVWDDIAESFDAEIGRDHVIAFCLERGYDLRRNPGTNDDAVVCWRDVGIMVLACERGLIKPDAAPSAASG